MPTNVFTILSLWLISFHLYANPIALTIYHRQGTAPMDDIGVKVMTIDGEPCFQKDNVSKYTQRLQIKETDLSCKKQVNYAVYASLGYWVSHLYVGDTYPGHGGECTITHDKDGWWSTKLTIRCSGS